VAGTIGLIVVGGAFLAVHLISPSGLGFGDVRLAAICGTAVAFGTSVTAAALCVIAAATLAGATCGLARRPSVPLAAYLLPASLVTLAVRLFG
jgi:leader peptidase (prepilin peptidase) / N-methyltransferase